MTGFCKKKEVKIQLMNCCNQSYHLFKKAVFENIIKKTCSLVYEFKTWKILY